jgi:hypothetical protein
LITFLLLAAAVAGLTSVGVVAVAVSARDHPSQLTQV